MTEEVKKKSFICRFPVDTCFQLFSKFEIYELYTLVKDSLSLFATSNVELIAGCASFNGWKAIAAGISFNPVKVTST